MGTGRVGYDRQRLRTLLVATDDAIASAHGVSHSDHHAQGAMASLRAADDFLAGPWRHTILTVLGGSWFERRIAGRTIPPLWSTADRCEWDPGPSFTNRPFADEPLDDLLTLLDELAWGWPRDREGHFLTDLDAFDPGVRQRLRELAHRIDDDPSILDRFATSLDRGARLDDIEMLGMMGAAGWFRPVVAIQVAALVGLLSMTHAATSDVTQRRHAIIEELGSALDVTPSEALDALHHAEVREWLVREDDLDPDAVAAFLGGAIHTTTVHDPDQLARSEHVWLSFVDLADEHGGRGFPPGVARGLAIGSAAHLPDLDQSDVGVIYRPGRDAVEFDGAELSHEQLSTLLGAIVTDPVAQTLLADLAHHVAVDGYRSRLALVDSSELAGEPFDRDDLHDLAAFGIAPAVNIVDLVFDDAVGFQQQRWNDIARAGAEGRNQLVDLLSAMSRAVPTGAALTAVVRSGLGALRSNPSADRHRLEVASAAKGLDTQLAREIVGSITTSPATGALFGAERFETTTIRALDRFADESASFDLHSVDDVVARLEHLGATSELDRSRIRSTVTDLLAPLTAEIEPTRDG